MQAGSEDTTRHCREAICEYNPSRYGPSQAWLHRRLHPLKENFVRAPELSAGMEAGEEAWQQLMLQINARILRDYAQTLADLKKKEIEEPPADHDMHLKMAEYVQKSEEWCRYWVRGLDNMCSDDDDNVLLQIGKRMPPSRCRTHVAQLLSYATQKYLQEVDEAMQQLEGLGGVNECRDIRQYYPRS